MYNIRTLTQKHPYYIKSNTHPTYTLKYIGIFIQNNLDNYIRFTKKSYNFLFKIKKIFYTFTKPNQVKNIILRRKSFLLFFKLVFSSSSKSKINTFLYKLKNTIITNNTKTLDTMLRYTDAKPKIKTLTNVSNAGSTVENFTEVKVNRVRFKPGYQRM